VPTVSATPHTALTRVAASLLVLLALAASGCAAQKGVGPEPGLAKEAAAAACAAPVPVPPHEGGPFVWRNPMPQGDSLLSVWGAGPDEVWAVGDRGRVLRYDGAAWHLADPGPTDYLAGVWGTAPDDVFVAGYNGRVLRFDGGRWWLLPTGVTNDFNGIWASGPKDAFAVGDRGVILHYDGTCWTPQATGTTDLFFGVSGTGPKDVWAVGGRGNVAHFDGGWHPVDVSAVAPDAHFVSVWAAAPGEVYVVGTRGTVLHLHDGRWTRVDAGTDALLRWVWGTGPTDVWVAGDGATVRQFDGAVWRGVDTGVEVPAAADPMGGDEHAVRGAWRSGPGGTTVLVGDDGLIVTGTGGALAPQRTGPVADLYAVAGAWAAGAHGTLLFRDTGGAWHPLPAAGTDSGTDTFLALALLADGRVLAAGTGGVWLGDAKGWRRLAWPKGVPDRTVFALKAWDRRAVAVGDGGLVLTFDGERLAAFHLPGDEALLGVAGAGPADFIVVGAGGAAYERTGGAWRAVPVAGGEDLLAVSDGGVAVGAMGGIYRRTPDDPAGWRTLAAPGAFALNAVADDPAGGAWAVGDFGAVRFVEGTEVRDVVAPTGRTLRGVDVAPDGRVTLVGDGGAVLERPARPGGVKVK